MMRSAKNKEKNMLKSAQSELKADLEIVELFSKQIPTHILSTCKTSLCLELTLKVFHARVYEYVSNGRGATRSGRKSNEG